jgi:hypothetical protein
MISGIRRDGPDHLAVIWADWKGEQAIKNGRYVRHLPTGCVFAVEWQGVQGLDLTSSRRGLSKGQRFRKSKRLERQRSGISWLPARVSRMEKRFRCRLTPQIGGAIGMVSLPAQSGV